MRGEIEMSRAHSLFQRSQRRAHKITHHHFTHSTPLTPPTPTWVSLHHWRQMYGNSRALIWQDYWG